MDSLNEMPPRAPPFSTKATRLMELRDGTSVESAWAFFDSLPDVPLAQMTGAWRGRGVLTGHPLNGLLESYGWYGKQFDGPEDVQPLVFMTSRGSRFNINPSLIPVAFVARHAEICQKFPAAHFFRMIARLLQTNKPKARLRRVEFRRVVSATMIYDSLPILDVFRLVDQDTVLGVMDSRGIAQPFFFELRRDSRFES